MPDPVPAPFIQKSAIIAGLLCLLVIITGILILNFTSPAGSDLLMQGSLAGSWIFLSVIGAGILCTSFLIYFHYRN